MVWAHSYVFNGFGMTIELSYGVSEVLVVDKGSFDLHPNILGSLKEL